MTQQGRLYIGGQWQPGEGPSFSSLDPSNAGVLWEGKEATNAQVEQAIQQAKQAFPLWSCTPLEQRVQILERFRSAVDSHSEELALTIAQETGKPLWDARNEVKSMIGKVAISIDAYHQRTGERSQQSGSTQLVTRHRPHGVVAIFGPYNFPAHLPTGHIVPALLAGNTIVFKPSEQTPWIAQQLVELWDSCGLPPGTINLVQGGKEVGKCLATHPAIDGLFFTGSWPTGHLLSQHFGRHPEKILALEMGGNNPLLIGTLSEVEAAVQLTIQSAYLSSGQRCTCARRLIVVESPQAEAFISRLQEKIGSIRVGSYRDNPEPFMGPLIGAHAAQDLLSAQDKLIAKGAIPLKKMEPLPLGPAFVSPGLLDSSAIATPDDQELFGPLLQLFRAKTLSEAIEKANRTAYGLAAGLLSENQEEYTQFFQSIRAGIVNWNAPLTGASSSAPFGGIGHSGNHRPSAYYAADYCSYPVASMENSQLTLPTTSLPGLGESR